MLALGFGKYLGMKTGGWGNANSGNPNFFASWLCRFSPFSIAAV